MEKSGFQKNFENLWIWFMEHFQPRLALGICDSDRVLEPGSPLLLRKVILPFISFLALLIKDQINATLSRLSMEA